MNAAVRRIAQRRADIERRDVAIASLMVKIQSTEECTITLDGVTVATVHGGTDLFVARSLGIDAYAPSDDGYALERALRLLAYGLAEMRISDVMTACHEVALVAEALEVRA